MIYDIRQVNVVNSFTIPFSSRYIIIGWLFLCVYLHKCFLYVWAYWYSFHYRWTHKFSLGNNVWRLLNDSLIYNYTQLLVCIFCPCFEMIHTRIGTDWTDYVHKRAFFCNRVTLYVFVFIIICGSRLNSCRYKSVCGLSAFINFITNFYLQFYCSAISHNKLCAT